MVRPPLPLQTSFFFFCSTKARLYVISRLSRGLQPQRLPFVGGQINAVSAAHTTHGSRSPHAVGEVRPCFSALSFSVSLLLLQSASIAAQQCGCIAAAFLV